MSADWDQTGRFPREGLSLLHGRGLLHAPPLAPTDLRSLLSVLADIGRGDLSVGRIYEGHVNALLLLQQYGAAEQQRFYANLAAGGHVFGVWNTDDPRNPLRLEQGFLIGGKAFASGSDGVSHAMVTVPHAEGRLMLMVPVNLGSIDRSWWRPLGMKASGSHVVDLSGIRVEPDWMVGKPGQYVGEPWFSAGSVRFTAVHTGGMSAMFDAAVSHLVAAGRAGDPFQAHRMARMGIAVESACLWLKRAAEYWAAAAADDATEADHRQLAAVANAARMATETAALEVLDLAEKSVGAAAFMAPSPLERIARDLRTYLRQPAPDRALMQIGQAIAQTDWRPGHAFLLDQDTSP